MHSRKKQKRKENSGDTVSFSVASHEKNTKIIQDIPVNNSCNTRIVNDSFPFWMLKR